MRYILFHHQTTTNKYSLYLHRPLRYILFHHQTTTDRHSFCGTPELRYILFHHQTTTLTLFLIVFSMLRYILFHHQTTTKTSCNYPCRSCVISSFITKPQLEIVTVDKPQRCVISSFITKPQHRWQNMSESYVALYPLSSPNHNTNL